MIVQLARAALVGLVAFLLSLLLLELLNLPTDPFALLIGLLAAVVTYFRGRVN